MKSLSFSALILLATASAFAQGAGPYDYWIAIAQVPDTTTNTTITQNVMVFAGNFYATGGGPHYDVVVTVKRNGTTVCSTGLTTQPPLLAKQQKNVVELSVSYPRPVWMRMNKQMTPRKYDKYGVTAIIRTDYPNQDTNPANGTATKEFSFPVGGTPQCKTLQ